MTETRALAQYRRILQKAEEMWPMDEPGLTLEDSKALLRSWPYETNPIIHGYLIRRHRALLDRVHAAAEKGNTK